MKSEGQWEFMNLLLKKPATCDVKVSVWHPRKAQLNWLLSLGQFRVKIHVDIPTIINLYDGRDTYISATNATLYFNDEDVEVLREHPKLKFAYEEWDKLQVSKMKGGEK